MDSKRSDTEAAAGRYAYEGLDRLLHEKARLGILTSLAARPEGLVFGELKSLCALTDGNLSRHLQVLEEEGVVEIWKGYHGRKPQTLCRISKEGRRRFLAYLAELERVVRDTAEARRGAGNAETEHELPKGWVPA
jgi:DNA-binding transcriptional ArsR family regulator